MIVEDEKSVFDLKSCKGIFNSMICAEGCINTIWYRVNPDRDIRNPSKLQEKIQTLACTM